jgi:adenosylcobinamide kinase/adenosylcobinamide-phosphate guanylyltransferase
MCTFYAGGRVRPPATGTKGLSVEINSDNHKTRIIFVTGGARGGKSSFALHEAEKIEGKKLFIATAEPLDSEMKARIEIHRKERGHDWDTAEVPLKIGETLKNQGVLYKAIVIDCLTLWLSNVMGGHSETLDRDLKVVGIIDTLVDDLQDIQHAPHRSGNLSSIFIVSNEVGMGIVPGNSMSRIFRDMAGQLNQKVAKIADEVYLIISGLPLQLKK